MNLTEKERSLGLDVFRLLGLARATLLELDLKLADDTDHYVMLAAVREQLRQCAHLIRAEADLLEVRLQQNATTEY